MNRVWDDPKMKTERFGSQPERSVCIQWAHVLWGESPEVARQREDSAKGKDVRREVEADEQESHTRP